MKMKHTRLEGLNTIYWQTLLLLLEVRNDVVNRTIRRIDAFAPLGLFYLEVDACVVLHPHDAKDGANGFRRLSASANDLAHVVFVDTKRQKNPHFVDGPVYFYVVRVINQRFDYVLQKLLISFHGGPAIL